jgi:hypothetical protein
VALVSPARLGSKAGGAQTPGPQTGAGRSSTECVVFSIQNVFILVIVLPLQKRIYLAPKWLFPVPIYS